MKHHLSKFLSLLLVTAMVLQILPASIFATESTDEYLSTLAEERPETAEEALNSAQILFEEESLREESVKHFRLDDGTYIAVDYGTPVHYEDDGEWVDYDNTLKAVNSLDGSGVSYYRVDNGDSTRVFAAEADADVLLAVQKGDYGLAFAPVQEPDAEFPISPNQPIVATDTAELVSSATVLDFASAGTEADDTLLSQAQPDKFYSALEYENAINGATLRYENYGNTIKESIVISEPQSEYVYSFTVETDGLTAELQEDGSVNFATTDGTIVYYIPAPYMIDANNEYSYNAAYTLTGSNSTYILTVTADPTWLNDETRAFPVLLDPTIKEELTKTSLSSTFVQSKFSNATSGGQNGIYVGDRGMVDGVDVGITRGYFHINNLIGIPVGCELISAEFTLQQFAYDKKESDADSLKIGLHELTIVGGFEEPDPASFSWDWWAENLTWEDANDYDHTMHDSIIADMQEVTSIPSGEETVGITWDITTLAQKWYANACNNIGFALIAEKEELAKSRASFYATGKIDSLAEMTVRYRNAVGLEPYYTYQTVGVGRAGTSYISDYTLQNTLVVPLVTSESNVMPFSLSMIYNSAYGNKHFTSGEDINTKAFFNMRLGKGWKLSAQETVILKSAEPDDFLIYTDADGTEHYFHYKGTDADGNKVYEDEDGLGLRITECDVDFDSTMDYTMTDRYNNKKVFGNGYLKFIKDAYQNEIEYSYNADAQLTSITRTNNGCSSEILATLEYENGNLIKVTNEAGKITTFAYTTDYLQSITFADGQSAEYAYDDSGQTYFEVQMISAYDREMNYGIEYAYGYNRDLRSIYEYRIEGTSKEYREKVHCCKRSHSQTVYHNYGDDQAAGTDDDFLTFKIFDSVGRTINSYTTDASERNILSVSASAYEDNVGTNKTNNHLSVSASGGMQGVNLLFNGNVEKGNGLTSARDWTRENSYVSRTNEKAYYGNYSFEFSRSVFAERVDRWQQTVTLTQNGTYTLSAYVHIPSATTFSASGGLRLTLLGETSEYINYSTQALNNGWLRITVSSTASAVGSTTLSIEASGYKGSIYVDAVQLEKGDAASTYNLTEDSSFEHGDIDTYWTCPSGTTAALGSGTFFGNNAAYLLGWSREHVYQQIDLNCPGNSIFLISGWAKGFTHPASVLAKATETDTYFGMYAKIHYTDGDDDEYEVHFFPCDIYYHDWQYVSGILVPKEADRTVEYVLVSAAYDHNINYAYFDNISFRMEPSQTYSYDDETGLPVAATETGTGTQSAVYSGVDLTEYIAANGNSTTYTYNDQHDVLTATLDGTKNTLTYDEATGNVTSSLLEGGSLEMKASATYTDDHNHTASVTDATGSTTTYTYNSAAELMTSSTNAKNIVTNYSYDANNYRTLQVSQGLDKSLTYGYANGHLSSMTRTSSRDGAYHWQRYAIDYNNWGQQKKVAVQSSTNGTTFTNRLTLVNYSYYGDDNTITPDTEGYSRGALQKMTYANGDSITYEYDELDRLTKKVYTDTGSYVNYYYNSEGVLARMTYCEANGAQLASYAFEYDSLGRLIRSAHYGEENDDLVQRTEHIYDSVNRLSSQSWVIGTSSFSESYTYNDPNPETPDAPQDGSLKSMTTASEATITYQYDALKRLSSAEVTDDSGTILSKSYDYKTISEDSGVTQTSPLVENYSVADKNGTILTGAKYLYDGVGNIVEIAQSTGNNNPLIRYTYDLQNQLTSATYYDGTGSASSDITKTYEYTYDTAGNLLTESVDGAVTKTYTYGNDQWNDLLTEYNGETILYESQNPNILGAPVCGNPISYCNGNRWEMEWEHGRNLTESVTTATNTSIVSENKFDFETKLTYTYDAEGIRTGRTYTTSIYRYQKKNSDGSVIMSTDEPDGSSSYDRYLVSKSEVKHHYVTQNGKVVRETVISGGVTRVLDYIYDESGRPSSVIFKDGTADEVTYYYVLNLQGDVEKIIDANGAVQAQYTYDPWGLVLSITDGDGNPVSNTHIGKLNSLRYRGYCSDTETQWYYLQSRYYDPVTHRFINADNLVSTEQSAVGTNLFAYCFNNPISLEDPEGNWPKWLKKAAKWVAKNVVKPVVKNIEEDLAEVDLTCSTGFNISATPSAVIFNLQVGVSIDTKGNVAIQYSGGGGFTGGSPGASFTMYQSITNAPNIDKLEGPSYQFGGSVGVPIYGFPFSVAGDLVIIPDSFRERTYYGSTANVGVGTPGAEFHVEWGETATWNATHFNMFDAARNIYHKIMEW